MDLVNILYEHKVVGNNIYFIYTKMGGTLPVLKNEIKDVCLCPAVRKRNL